MRRIVAVLGVLILLLGVKMYKESPAECEYADNGTVVEQSEMYESCEDYGSEQEEKPN